MFDYYNAHAILNVLGVHVDVYPYRDTDRVIVHLDGEVIPADELPMKAAVGVHLADEDAGRRFAPLTTRRGPAEQLRRNAAGCPRPQQAAEWVAAVEGWLEGSG